LDKNYQQLVLRESEHPRITKLRSQVLSLPVDDDYRAALLQSIDTYADQLLARPDYKCEGEWDDLEALQQVTMADVMERALLERLARDRVYH
jgi:hypothetical protein